jgi:phospholipase C
MDLNLIDTIVVMMMENWSFDHILGYLSLASTDGLALDGLRDDPQWLRAVANLGPDGVAYEPSHLGQWQIPDPPHERANITIQLGKPSGGVFPMDGFVASAGGDSEVMCYYTGADAPVTDFFARHFRVCDRWFSSLPASTQPNRLMAMAGYTLIDRNVTELPNHFLVYDWLTAHNVRWRVYHDGMFPFFSIMPRLWPTIAASEHFRRFDRLAIDAELEPDATWPQVIFIEPTYTDAPHLGEADDDHPPSSILGGQHLMLKAYNALTANNRRWLRTMMILTYDEHGGFFDHVSPIALTTASPAGQYATFTSSGVRVPSIIISPLVSAGVCSEVFDHTSILKFIGEKFGLGGGYLPIVDSRPTASVSRAIDLEQPRTDLPTPPSESQIPTAAGAPPLAATPNNNSKAFLAAAGSMGAQYAHELVTRFPDQRTLIGR